MSITIKPPVRCPELAGHVREASNYLLRAQQWTESEADYTVLRLALDMLHPLTIPS